MSFPILILGSYISLVTVFAVAWMGERGSEAIRILLRLFAAVLLMAPVYSALDWSMHGWFIPPGKSSQTFKPWLDFVYSIGFGKTRGDILTGTVFAFSFMIAIVSGWIIEQLFRLLLPNALDLKPKNLETARNVRNPCPRGLPEVNARRYQTKSGLQPSEKPKGALSRR